ncbi:MAG: hypothetical protein R3E39_20070 [Anaerolineae bacterium]
MNDLHLLNWYLVVKKRRSFAQIRICGVVCLLILLVTACSGGATDNNQTAQPIATATSGQIQVQVQKLPVNVLTNRYNNLRSGENLNENILNPSVVNVEQFGKLFSRSVVGDIYAQPLYVENIEMADGQKHNIVYVATMHNMVYAFDADDPAQSDPLWAVDLGTPFTQNIFFDIPGGEDGILSTPVIDLATKTMYLVARTAENEKAVYKFHALDIVSGAERDNSPTVIELSYPGTGLNSVNGIVTLDADNQLQRTGMLLYEGKVIFGFGSNNDRGDWFGWVVAYDATTLQQTAVFNTTPNGYQGGIWMAGSGVVTDGDYLYLVVANGLNTLADGGVDYGMSILKMTLEEKAFKIIDYYVPSNYDELNKADSGLGSTGLVFIPNTDYMVAGGKDGKLYVVDRTKLGGYNPSADASLQVVTLGPSEVYMTPVIWDSGPDGKQTVYAWDSLDTLKAFSVSTATRGIVPQPVSESTLKAVGRPIGGMTISANGTDQSSGILWATFAPEADKNTDGRGALLAFDATNLKKLLWYSDQHGERDALGTLSKFAPPTVANGKVYVPTFSDQLVVYGMLDTASSEGSG